MRFVALILCWSFVFWLFAKDRTRSFALSPGLWLASAWIALQTSKPPSVWLGTARVFQSADDYLEGDALDRNLGIFLLVAAVIVLARRGIRWSEVIAKNKWLFVMFFYFALSFLWSKYPEVAAKRWVKDVGNVAFILVILTDENPGEAIKAVFLRCAYVLVPVSALLIKYYPNLGRNFAKAGDQSFTGVTSNKNELGTLLLVSGLFLVWEILDRRDARREGKEDRGMFPLYALAVLIAWLFHMAHSATSQACFILGTALFWGLRYPFLQKRIKNLGMYSAMAVLSVLLFQAVPSVANLVTGLVGRDASLTGRTDIWKMVLAEHTNPLIGTGYFSFWLGERDERFWKIYAVKINESHNGYLETYLNTGLIGVALLVIVLVSAGGRIKKGLLAGEQGASIRLTLLVIGVIYNCTEASFDRYGIIWIAVLLAVLQPPDAWIQYAQPDSELPDAESEAPPEKTEELIVPGVISDWAPPRPAR